MGDLGEYIPRCGPLIVFVDVSSHFKIANYRDGFLLIIFLFQDSLQHVLPEVDGAMREKLVKEVKSIQSHIPCQAVNGQKDSDDKDEEADGPAITSPERPMRTCRTGPQISPTAGGIGGEYQVRVAGSHKIAAGPRRVRAKKKKDPQNQWDNTSNEGAPKDYHAKDHEDWGNGDAKSGNGNLPKLFDLETILEDGFALLDAQRRKERSSQVKCIEIPSIIDDVPKYTTAIHMQMREALRGAAIGTRSQLITSCTLVVAHDVYTNLSRMWKYLETYFESELQSLVSNKQKCLQNPVWPQNMTEWPWPMIFALSQLHDLRADMVTKNSPGVGNAGGGRVQVVLHPNKATSVTYTLPRDKVMPTLIEEDIDEIQHQAKFSW